MTTSTHVSPGAVTALKMSYRQLVKAGNDSVRAAWRFGQTVDSFSEAYSRRELAQAIGISNATIYRYHRFFSCYQRPELAVEAAEQLETFNIDLLTDLALQRLPEHHARPLAGRRFRYTCASCGGTEVHRVEITGDDEDDDEDALPVHTRPEITVVPSVRFRGAV